MFAVGRALCQDLSHAERVETRRFANRSRARPALQIAHHQAHMPLPSGPGRPNHRCDRGRAHGSRDLPPPATRSRGSDQPNDRFDAHAARPTAPSARRPGLSRRRRLHRKSGIPPEPSLTRVIHELGSPSAQPKEPANARPRPGVRRIQGWPEACTIAPIRMQASARSASRLATRTAPADAARSCLRASAGTALGR
jgi:hypothetical protein